MPKAKRYTQKQIEDAWESYSDMWCFRYNQAGMVHITKDKPDTSEQGIVNLERMRYREVMGFPRFLKVLNG